MRADVGFGGELTLETLEGLFDVRVRVCPSGRSEGVTFVAGALGLDLGDRGGVVGVVVPPWCGGGGIGEGLVDAGSVVGGAAFVGVAGSVSRSNCGVEFAACASGDEVLLRRDAGADDLWRERWWWVYWWTWVQVLWVRVGGRGCLGGLGLARLGARCSTA
jgi:hypothetical protein